MKDKNVVKIIAASLVTVYGLLLVLNVALVLYFTTIALQTANPWLLAFLGILILFFIIVVVSCLMIIRIIIKKGPYDNEEGNEE